MGRRRGQRLGWLRKHRGSWLLTYRDYAKVPPRQTENIGPCIGPGALTKKQAERFAWDHFLAPLDNSVRTPWSTLTLSQFWERFYREHLEKKRKYSTASQYKSLWKLWIEPRLGAIRLFEIRPLMVDAAIKAVLAGGKGSSTAKHVRKVISAMLEQARGLQMFTGDNPTRAIEIATGPIMRKKRALSVEQCRAWLSICADTPRDPKDRLSIVKPVRTMSLLGLVCSLGISEQLGLRWEHLNLADEARLIDGEVVPEKSLAIWEHSYHGRRDTVKHGHRRRILPLPEVLVKSLKALREESLFKADEDPVFVGANGKPLWGDTLQAKTIQPLAKTIDMEWLSWHILRHTCATLTKSAGMLEPDRQALMGHAPATMTAHYTHEDFDRMRAKMEEITLDITKPPKPEADSDSQLTMPAEIKGVA